MSHTESISAHTDRSCTDTLSVARQRKRMSGEDRRRAILESAMSVFSIKGFNGATTKEIAKKVGVSEAIIFRHFPTKQDLYSATLNYKASESLKQLWSSCEEAMQRRDDERVFYTLAYEILEMYRKDPGLLRLLYFCALEGHEMAKAFANTTGKTARDKLSRYIQERVDAKAFRNVDAANATRSFFGVVSHRAIQRELFQDNELQNISSSELANEIVDIFLRGVIAIN
ncbi:MAG: TetR/AcrR family transcriptional regulator [Blastocatellia bacterium]|nr:TetR/AcrR family transcriptional regulator [Blastocatellia bacterium]